MACNGRLTIAVYTLRYVQAGEELTFDYSSVTESEREFRYCRLLNVLDSLIAQCWPAGACARSMVLMWACSAQGCHLPLRHQELSRLLPVFCRKQSVHASPQHAPHDVASAGHLAPRKHREGYAARQGTPGGMLI